MIDLNAAEERVRALIAEARNAEQGFRTVCEKLDVDVEEADAFIARLGFDPACDELAMNVLLVGVAAGASQR